MVWICGRIHLGARLRRIALATAGFLVVALPPGAWAGALVHHWQNIEPHHDDYRITKVCVDPRGEWAVVNAGRSLPCAPKWVAPPGALWAIRLEDGEILDLSDVANGVGWFPESAPGSCRVKLHRADRGPEGEGENYRIVEYAS